MNNDLHKVILDEKELREKTNQVCDYLSKIIRKTDWKPWWWSFVYYFCNVMLIWNVLLQIWFLDRLMDQEFTTYGIEVIDQQKKIHIYIADNLCFDGQ